MGASGAGDRNIDGKKKKKKKRTYRRLDDSYLIAQTVSKLSRQFFFFKRSNPVRASSQPHGLLFLKAGSHCKCCGRSRAASFNINFLGGDITIIMTPPLPRSSKAPHFWSEERL